VRGLEREEPPEQNKNEHELSSLLLPSSLRIHHAHEVPPLPPPEKRLAELKTFTEVLADKFIDYGHLDVYDSIFRQRVDEIVENIKFDEDSQHIEEFGEYIRATNSTKCRDFLKFFMMILAYFGQ